MPTTHDHSHRRFPEAEQQMVDEVKKFLGHAHEVQDAVRLATGYLPSVRIELPAPAFDLWHAATSFHPWDGKRTIEYSTDLTIVRGPQPF